MNVLALSGSLRAASINSAFCRAAARLAPAPMTITVFSGLGALPLFNPDLEADPPSSVLVLRSAVADSRGLIVASPEYAHGISGVMKNAYEALREVLQTMSTDIVSEASVTVPLLGSGLTDDGMVDSPGVAATIEDALAAFARRLAPAGGSNPSFPLGDNDA